MGPIWGRQDPGGSHFGPMNFAILDVAVKTVVLDTAYDQYRRHIHIYERNNVCKIKRRDIRRNDFEAHKLERNNPSLNYRPNIACQLGWSVYFFGGFLDH